MEYSTLMDQHPSPAFLFSCQHQDALPSCLTLWFMSFMSLDMMGYLMGVKTYSRRDARRCSRGFGLPALAQAGRALSWWKSVAGWMTMGGRMILW